MAGGLTAMQKLAADVATYCNAVVPKNTFMLRVFIHTPSWHGIGSQTSIQSGLARVTVTAVMMRNAWLAVRADAMQKQRGRSLPTLQFCRAIGTRSCCADAFHPARLKHTVVAVEHVHAARVFPGLTHTQKILARPVRPA
jgi:hypothetical protein